MNPLRLRYGFVACFAVVACALVVGGCGIPDRTPEETAQALEEAGQDRDFGKFRALFSEAKVAEAQEAFLETVAEQQNRTVEGVNSRKATSAVSGLSSTVTIVYDMRDGVRRTYEWELVRERDRWRASSWSVAVDSSPPSGP